MEFFNAISKNDFYDFGNLQIILTTHSPLIVQHFFKKNSTMFIFKRDNHNNLKVLDTAQLLGWASEKLLREAFNTDLFSTNRAVLFVEGETDEMYLRKCLEVFEMFHFPYEVKWIGNLDQMKKPFFTGKTALDQFKAAFLAQEDLFLFPVILLYDSDSNKAKESFGKLRVEVLPHNNSNVLYQIGIENMLQLPQDFDPSIYYDKRTKIDKYSAESTITALDKTKLCRYVCSLSNGQLRTIFSRLHAYLTTLNE